MGFVAVSRRASRDIEAIERYALENWGPNTAERYLSAIDFALQRLRTSPSVLRSIPRISDHFDFYRVRDHFLVCVRRGDDIYVLAAIHASMDLPTRILELEPTLLQETELLYKSFLRRKPK